MRYDYKKIPAYVSLDDFIDRCIEVRTKTICEYPSACNFYVEIMVGEYEDDDPYVAVSFNRDPTANELETELKLKKLLEEKEKLQYEKLKAKFEGK